MITSQSPGFFNRIHLNLFRRIGAPAPGAFEWEIPTEPVPAELGGKRLAATDGGANLVLRSAPFDQAFQRVRMEPDVHGSPCRLTRKRGQADGGGNGNGGGIYNHNLGTRTHVAARAQSAITAEHFDRPPVVADVRPLSPPDHGYPALDAVVDAFNFYWEELQ